MKWTYDICHSLALKYTVQRDFRAENRGAFDAAIRKGWMKDFSWLKDGRECAKPHPTRWSYDACCQEAKKYETRTDFMRGNESAYHKSLAKGWMSDYSWFMDGNKRNAERNTKWTYEACLELAKGCKRVKDLIKKSLGAYDAARRNGWLKDYTWFKNPYPGFGGGKGKWAEETCRESALKYSVKRDFYEANPRAYNAARYHGWLKDYTWLRDGRDSGITRNLGFKVNQNFNHSHPKYTDEQIIKAAKKYTKKVDFLHNDNALYHAALKRGLLDRFSWLQSSAHLFDNINFVYRYYFKGENAVYVGRTINPKDRDFDHHRERGNESSTVLKFAQEKGVEIPPMEILAERLSGIDSQRVEDEYVRKYRTEGMLVLNKGATGVGRGSMGMKRKHTKKKFLEVARQYKKLYNFAKENPKLYNAACKYGWIKEYDSLERQVRPSETFTKEFCMRVARQCFSRKELEEKDSTVYEKMIKMGWIDECDWIVPQNAEHRELTHEYCMSVARQYSSVKEIKLEHPSVLSRLYKMGWINECDWFPRLKRAINQYSLEGEFIATYGSVSEAEHAIGGKNRHQDIILVCKGNARSAYGFLWRYADEAGTGKIEQHAG